MREKIWGVLAAGALGDAMGMPTECWSQEKIRQNFPDGVTELIASNENDVFGRKLAAGAITDDTLNVLRADSGGGLCCGAAGMERQFRCFRLCFRSINVESFG